MCTIILTLLTVQNQYIIQYFHPLSIHFSKLKIIINIYKIFKTIYIYNIIRNIYYKYLNIFLIIYIIYKL